MILIYNLKERKIFFDDYLVKYIHHVSKLYHPEQCPLDSLFLVHLQTLSKMYNEDRREI